MTPAPAKGKTKLPMTLYICFSCFVVLIGASGFLHGMQTGRWVPLPDLDKYNERLDLISLSVGDWEGTRFEPADQDWTLAGVSAHSSIRYHHRPTDSIIEVLLLCGRPGPVSVHTPDVCYRGAGFDPIGEPQRMTINSPDQGAPSEWWRLSFRNPARTGRLLDVHWAWISPRGIESPEQPRVAFSGDPVLYKVYVSRERSAISVSSQNSEDKAASDFLSAFSLQLELALVLPARGKNP